MEERSRERRHKKSKSHRDRSRSRERRRRRTPSREHRHSRDRRIRSRSRESKRKLSIVHTFKEPLTKQQSTKEVNSLAAAAEAAARIAADLKSRNGLPSQYVPPPPPEMPTAEKELAKLKFSEVRTSPSGKLIIVVDINDIRNRYLLTKDTTQRAIESYSSTKVSTHGKYFPSRSLASSADIPLNMHVVADNSEQIDKALEKIKEFTAQIIIPQVGGIKMFGSPYLDAPYFEALTVGLDSVPGFNVRNQVVGPSGSYIQHIKNETDTKIQLKGRGSGFIEPSLGKESTEPLSITIYAPSTVALSAAKQLCEDLIATVKKDYETFLIANPAIAQVYNPYYLGTSFQRSPIQGLQNSTDMSLFPSSMMSAYNPQASDQYAIQYNGHPNAMPENMAVSNPYASIYAHPNQGTIPSEYQSYYDQYYASYYANFAHNSQLNDSNQISEVQNLDQAPYPVNPISDSVQSTSND